MFQWKPRPATPRSKPTKLELRDKCIPKLELGNEGKEAEARRLSLPPGKGFLELNVGR
jgi:hypothetical protein